MNRAWGEREERREEERREGIEEPCLGVGQRVLEDPGRLPRLPDGPHRLPVQATAAGGTSCKGCPPASRSKKADRTGLRVAVPSEIITPQPGIRR